MSACTRACLLLLLACWAVASWPQTPKQELKAVRGKIKTLEDAIARDKQARQGAHTAARRSGQAIEAINRELDVLARKQTRLRAQLNELEQRKDHVRARIRERQRVLAKLYYRSYVERDDNSVALLLRGHDPDARLRQAQYVSYLTRYQASLVAELRDDLTGLKRLGAETAEGAAALNQAKQEENEKRAELLRVHTSQLRSVARLDERIEQQRESIASYRRDESRLTHLVDQLTKALARKKRKQLRRAEGSRVKREQQSARAAPTAREQVGGREVAGAAQGSSAGTGFARLRGVLHWPIAGELLSRFGSPRAEGGSRWKGIQIRSARLQQVKAVAKGDIVYADWLRGFGNLVIVDHGDGYMSLYGYNDSLLKRAGESVNGGEPLASVGPSSENGQTGLYFELRHNSRPIDPLGWLGN